MTSTTLSVNAAHPFRSLYCWTLQRHKGISILYTVLLFLIFPMPVLLDGLDREYNLELVHGMLPACIVPLTMLFTLIYSGVLFRYMHKKRSVDLFYSLPVKRNTLLLARYFAGLTHIIVPLLLNYLFLSIFIVINPSLGRINVEYPGYGFENFTKIILYLCLSVAASMAFTMFIAVCSGNMMDTLVSTVVINLMYPLLIFLVVEVSGCLLPGIVLQFDFAPPVLTLLCPYGSMFSCYQSMLVGNGTYSIPWAGFYTVWWIFFTIAMIAAAMWLNRKRKGEVAESSPAFPIPSIVIRAVAAITAGLGIGYIMALSMTGTMGEFLVGMLIGSFGVHFILEAVYSRGFQHMLHSLPYYGGALALLGVYLLVMGTGAFGEVYRIPTADSIEKVVVMVSDNSTYPGMTKMDHSGYWINDIDYRKPEITSEAGKENAIELHQTVLNSVGGFGSMNHMQEDLFRPYHYATISIQYTLQNGEVLLRNYQGSSVLHLVQGSAALSQVLDSEEYTKAANVIYHIEAPDIDTFVYRDDQGDGYKTLLANFAQKEQLLEALRQDVLEDSVEKYDTWAAEGILSFGYLQIQGYQPYDSEGKTPAGTIAFSPEEYLVPSYYTRTNEVLKQLHTGESSEN